MDETCSRTENQGYRGTIRVPRTFSVVVAVKLPVLSLKSDSSDFKHGLLLVTGSMTSLTPKTFKRPPEPP